MLGSEKERWVALANCRGSDPEIFYPPRFAGRNANVAAKAICAECLVVEECLEYGLVIGDKFGIYGGKTERERRAIRRERTITRDPYPA